MVKSENGSKGPAPTRTRARPHATDFMSLIDSTQALLHPAPSLPPMINTTTTAAPTSRSVADFMIVPTDSSRPVIPDNSTIHEGVSAEIVESSSGSAILTSPPAQRKRRPLAADFFGISTPVASTHPQSSSSNNHGDGQEDPQAEATEHDKGTDGNDVLEEEDVNVVVDVDVDVEDEDADADADREDNEGENETEEETEDEETEDEEYGDEVDDEGEGDDEEENEDDDEEDEDEEDEDEEDEDEDEDKSEADEHINNDISQGNAMPVDIPDVSGAMRLQFFRDESPSSAGES